MSKGRIWRRSREPVGLRLNRRGDEIVEHIDMSHRFVNIDLEHTHCVVAGGFAGMVLCGDDLVHFLV